MIHDSGGDGAFLDGFLRSFSYTRFVGGSSVGRHSVKRKRAKNAFGTR